jgi:hypothetical protein
VTGNPDPTGLDNLFDIVVPPPVSWWPPAPGWYVVGGLAIALAVWGAWRWWERWRAAAYRRAALAELRRLEARAADGARHDAALCERALFIWLGRVHPRHCPATIEQDLPAIRTDAELRTLVEGLQAAVVAGQKRWDGAALAAALRRARSRRGDEPLAAALPALNPG